MGNQEKIYETLQDMAIFVGWMVFGVLVGWFIAFLAGHNWMESPFFDFYGMAGAAIAVLWISFRRQKHLEHLSHVRTHLEKIAGKRK